MLTWLAHLWERIRGSLWFLPSLMCLGAAGLAYGTPPLEGLVADTTFARRFLYQGSPEGVRTLLSTVAGSMITVAGVSFSVTMVALSLASSQLGPRLLVSFMRDRGNQLVLGGFIGTFLYCLLVLSSVPTGSDPFLSVSASLALVLAVSSLALFIYFIHHIASSMQADHVVDVVARELDRSLQKVFPEQVDSPDSTWEPDAGIDASIVSGTRAGYVQSIDEARLLCVAVEGDLRLQVLCRAGHFVITGDPLVRVEGRTELDAETETRIQRSFLVGGRRTAEQDPEFGLRQLVEIAVRALSPGVNDPFTASTCVDRLSGVLGAVAARPERPALRCDAEGAPRVRFDRIDFSGVLDAAFDQIRQCSVGVPAVAIRLLEALAAIARVTVDPVRRDALERHARMVVEGGDSSWNVADREVLKQRYREVVDVLGAPVLGGRE